MALELRSIINYTASIATLGALAREFGLTLFLTTDDSVLTNGANRVRLYADTDSVGDDYLITGGVTPEPRKAADSYFAQVPYPKNLIVGRWVNADIAAELRSQPLATGAAAFEAIQALSAASFTVLGETFSAVDWSAISTYTDLAADVQTRLRTSSNVNLATATCTFDPLRTQLTLTASTPGVDSALTFFTGDDESITVLGFSEASGATLTQGQAAESIETALTACVDLIPATFICLDNALDEAANLQTSVWTQSRPYLFSAASSVASDATAGVSSFGGIGATQPERTFGTWSLASDYKALSIAAFYSSIDFSGSNTLRTGKFATLPNTTPDVIDITQKFNLDAKRINHYSPYSGTPYFAEGYCFKPGVWVDARYFLDWFTDAVIVAQANFISSGVPQTEQGITALQGVIEGVAAQAVRNGGIAPGQLSPALTLDVQRTTGNVDFDGFLPRGFLIYHPPIVDQSQSDREQRIAVPGKIWFKGSGFIHFANGSIIFEN